MTDPEAATPEASGSRMDLVGKTVRWEDPSGRDWFTAIVVKPHRKPGMYYGEVLDPGTFAAHRRDLFGPDGKVLLFRDLCTVVDSEPVTEDEECE